MSNRGKNPASQANLDRTKPAEERGVNAGRVSARLLERLQSAAQQQGVTQRAYLEALIEAHCPPLPSRLPTVTGDGSFPVARGSGG